MQRLTPSSESPQDEHKNRRLMTTDSALSLHTPMANALWEGDWRHKNMGLKQYAQVTTLLWNASKADDPYADQQLMRVYAGIEKARVTLLKHEAALHDQLANLRGFEISLFRRVEPIKKPLHFYTPYGFMGARLIELLDYINRQLLTLHRLALTPADNLKPWHIKREVQSVFWLARGWRATGVTRQDMLAQNEKAQRAHAKLGEVPPRILERKFTFKYLPWIKHHAQTQPHDHSITLPHQVKSTA